MTVKHIRKNYQAGPSQAATPGTMAAPPMMPKEMQRSNPGQMMAQMPREMQQSISGGNKSWVFGIVLILVIIAALWYFMNKKKGSVSYFY